MQTKIIIVIIWGLCLISCSDTRYTKSLASRIDSMTVLKQKAELQLTEKGDGNNSYNRYVLKKILLENAIEAQKIFYEYGFPDFELVGKKASKQYLEIASSNYADVYFQQTLLDSMLEDVLKGDAYAPDYARLMDQVRLKQGLMQLYGTQVNYDSTTGIATSKNLYDAENVDARREQMKLPPLQDYLDELNQEQE